jgi:hypothetical protein
MGIAKAWHDRVESDSYELLDALNTLPHNSLHCGMPKKKPPGLA